MISIVTQAVQKICHTALEAARRKFSPEFINWIDKVVDFRGLAREQLRRALGLELQQVLKVGVVGPHVELNTHQR